MASSPLKDSGDDRIQRLLTVEDDEDDKRRFFERIEQTHGGQVNYAQLQSQMASSTESALSIPRSMPPNPNVSASIASVDARRSVDSRVSFDLSPVSSHAHSIGPRNGQSMSSTAAHAHDEDDDVVNYGKQETLRLSKSQDSVELLRKIEELSRELESERRKRTQLSIELKQAPSDVPTDEQLQKRFEPFEGRLAKLIPADLLSEIKKEYLQQERLLIGFQKENEHLVEEARMIRERANARERELLETLQRVRTEGGIIAGPPADNSDIIGAKQRIAELSKELAVARAAQDDLVEEINSLKAERRAMAKNLDVGRIDAEADAVKVLQQKMQMQHQQLESQLKEAREKLDYWQEQAEWKKEKEAELTRYKDKVAELTRQIQCAKPISVSHKPTASSALSSATDAKGGKKKPLTNKDDKIAQLIEAARPSVEHEDTIRKLEMRVQELEQEKRDANESFETKVRNMQMDLSRMRENYQRKLAVLEDELRSAGREASIPLSGRGDGPVDAGTSKPLQAVGQKPQAVDAQKENVSRQENVAELSSEIQRLTVAVMDRERRINELQMEQSRQTRERDAQYQEQSRLLRQEIDRLSSALIERERRMTELQVENARQSRENEIKNQEAYRLMRLDYENQLKQRSQEAQEQLKSLQQVVIQLSNKQMETPVSALSADGKDMSVMQLLQARITAMEAQLRQRQELTARAVEEIKHLSQVEMDVLRQKYEILLHKKQVEIDQFRSELDIMMNKVAKLALSKKKRKHEESPIET